MINFYGVKNVEFEGYQVCEEVKATLPVFTLNELSVEEWNRRARIGNTKAFIDVFGRDPESYEEVKAWVNSFLSEIKESRPVAPEATI